MEKRRTSEEVRLENERLHNEWQKKREQRKYLPKIAGSKDEGKIKGKHYYSGLWLTKLEKDIIYRKYTSAGYDWKFIKKRYEEIRSMFEKKMNKLKEQKKTDEEINKNFKEEFAKLLMEDGKC